jgi:uncharacterized protein HemX
MNDAGSPRHETAATSDPPNTSADEPRDTASQGPSLVLLYSLLAIALAAAIGIALLIVFPFYQRR